MQYILKANRLEDQLIDSFGKSLQPLQQLSDIHFKEMLLQKRFVSFQFTPLYDEAICYISDPDAKKILIALRNAEYPKGKPSHREDLFTDLQAIGITMQQIGTTRPTPTTLSSIDSLYNLVRPQTRQTKAAYTIRCVAGLRMAEEILVSEEYEIIGRELKRRFNLDSKDSVFFEPHRFHDKKRVPLGQSGKSHSDAMGKVLASYLTTENSYKVAETAIKDAYRARLSFFDRLYS